MIRLGLRTGLPLGDPKPTPTNERTNGRTERILTEVYQVQAVDARARMTIRTVPHPKAEPLTRPA